MVLSPVGTRASPTLKALIAAGRGDVPLIRLRWRCGRCGSRLTDWVCSSKYAMAAKPGFGHLIRDDDQPTTST
jgi:hypothetical protein